MTGSAAVEAPTSAGPRPSREGCADVTIIGAGISGLAAAMRLDQLRPEWDVRVIEAASRVGGMIESRPFAGGLIDVGPEALATNKPEGLALIDELGLTSHLVEDGPGQRRTFMVRNGRLMRLPHGALNPTRATLDAYLDGDLLDARAKLRLLAEPLVPIGGPGGDESVASFVRRRLGQAVLDDVIGPLVGGIHGTDPAVLSARMVLPAFVRCEAEGRSILAVATERKGRQPAQARPPLVTLAGGMAELTDAMAARLSRPVDLGREVTSISIDEGSADGPKWRAATSGGPVHSRRLLLAVPAATAATLLGPIAPALARDVDSLPATDSRTVTFAFAAADVDHPMDGTGFIVPASEGRVLAACTWVGRKWHHRAASGVVVIRCFLRTTTTDPEELERLARTELAELMALDALPIDVVTWTRDRSLPTSMCGHGELVSRIRAAAEALDGLAVAGAGLEGSGLPACIRSGHSAADQLAGAS